MTREEALTIVSMIVNTWPGQVWEVERLDAYARAIESMDAEITTLAVARAVREVKYRPSVAELLEYCRIERRLSEPDEARLMPVDKPPLPSWVQRWQRARKAGDLRFFPEQIQGADSLARSDPLNYKAYRPPDTPITHREDWVQPDEFLG